MAARILVVDDQPEIGRLVQVMLEGRYDVYACRSHAEALRQARARLFDLVVIDINLQNTRNGPEVLRDLRRLSGYASVPMVALSGYAAPNSLARFVAHGFDAYIQKPFTRHRLVETIERTLEDASASGSASGAPDEEGRGQIYAYRIDAQDVLTDIADDWLAFARANDAQHLTRPVVVGRPLWDFIADDTTRHLYRMLLDRVRSTHHPITVPFRCDGPSCRRFMELEIHPGDAGEIEFRGVLLRTEERTPLPLFDADAPRRDESVTCCGWCKRVWIAPAWVEIEDAARSLRLTEQVPPPRLTHGICPDCYDIITERLHAA